MERISEAIFLYVIIQRGICHEAGRLVHLNEPRLAKVIKKNVDSKDLEAMRVFHVLGLRRFVKMSNLMNPAHYCFYADLLDVLPNFISCLIFFVLSVCIDIVENGRKRALVSDIVMILVFILDEAVGLLVNRVVGQMHT